MADGEAAPSAPSERHVREPGYAGKQPEAPVPTKGRSFCSEASKNQHPRGGPGLAAADHSEKDKGKEGNECLLSTYYVPDVSPDRKTQEMGSA